MDREILFRGKRVDNGEWVKGYLVVCDKHYYILTGKIDIINGFPQFEHYLVIPETVGQYTGLTDKRGKKIFDGDIVKFKHGGEFAEKGIYFRNYVVEYINTFVTYGLRLRNKNIHFLFKQSTATMHGAIIIGNIHDNQELLEVQNG